MNIVICDVCKRCIIGNDPSKDATMRFEDLFGSRTFTTYNPAEDYPETKELTLCTDCKETMFFYMVNKRVLSRDIQSMSLSNRLRILFKKPPKIKGAVKCE